jgi:hypothetical protein
MRNGSRHDEDSPGMKSSIAIYPGQIKQTVGRERDVAEETIDEELLWQCRTRRG